MKTDNTSVMARHRSTISDEQIEADPRVVRARAAVEEAERAHRECAASSGRFEGLLPRVNENAQRARAELEGLRSRLGNACAGVLLGKIPESEETDLLSAIAAAERVVRRCELGRPVIEARIAAARRGIVPRVTALESRQEELERVRERVRDELAQKTF